MLNAIREDMIAEGWVRRQINKHSGTIRMFFRWCVEEQLVPASVWDTLRALRPLAPGRGGVVEGTPREPADPAAVEASLQFMSPAVKAIVLLLRFTGARPTEILQMTPERIDRTGEVWKYAPLHHKTAWKGKARVVYFGPEAQTVLSSWIEDVQPGEYIFSPAKSDAMRMALRSATRKTPRYPSQMKRNEQKRVDSSRKRPPADRYDHLALSRAVNRACKKAGVAAYSAYCLRHLRAVELREKFGLESVRAVLGQTSMAMAEHYFRRADEKLASAASAAIG